MTGVALSVDIGAATTKAVYTTSGSGASLLLFDGRPTMPSAVYVDDHGGLVTGTDAVAAGLRRPDRMLSAPMARLGAGAFAVADQTVDPIDMIAAILARAANEAVTFTGLPVAWLSVVEQPGWGAQRRSLIRQAAHRAGLPEPQLVLPAVAAATHAGVPVPAGGCLLVCDVGAGEPTCAMVERQPDGGWTVVSSLTAPGAGGDALDTAIARTAAAELAEADPKRWNRLQTPANAEDAADRARLWRAARQAKRHLPDGLGATLPMPDPYPAVTLTAAQLDDLVAPVRETIADAARRTVDVADLTPGALTSAILVGAATRLPGLAAAVQQAVEVPVTVARQAEHALALGALRAGPAPSRVTWADTGVPTVAWYHLGGLLVAGAASLAVLIHTLRSAYISRVGITIDYVLVNKGEYTIACLLAMLAALAAGRVAAITAIHRFTDPGERASQPAGGAARRPARPAGGLLAAVVAGLVAVGIYGLLAGIYLHQPAGPFVRLGLQLSIPFAMGVALLAALLSRLAYLGPTALDHLHHPIIGMLLGTAGIIALQAGVSMKLPDWYRQLLDHGGTALLGAACAWTATRYLVPRLIAVPALAIAGAAVFSVDTSQSIGYAYVAAIYVWWILRLAVITSLAFPQAWSRTRQRLRELDAASSDSRHSPSGAEGGSLDDQRVNPDEHRRSVH